MQAENLIQKIQAKIAEQNNVILEQQVQIEEQKGKIEDLEAKLAALESAEADKQLLISKLSELVD